VGAPIVQMFHTLGKMKDAVASDPSQRETARRIDVETEIVQYADRLVAELRLRKINSSNSIMPIQPPSRSCRRAWTSITSSPCP